MDNSTKAAQHFAHDYIDQFIDILNDIGTCVNNKQPDWQVIRTKLIALQHLITDWQHSDLLYQLLSDLYSLATTEPKQLDDEQILKLSQRINQRTLILADNAKQVSTLLTMPLLRHEQIVLKTTVVMLLFMFYNIKCC